MTITTSLCQERQNLPSPRTYARGLRHTDGMFRMLKIVINDIEASPRAVKKHREGNRTPVLDFSKDAYRLWEPS